MANNSTNSAKTKVIHAGFLLADPDIQPKSEQSILIEGERIKAVSDGFIDPPPGCELIEAGVDSIEHGSFLDARSLELFIAKGAFHVPTIIAGVTVLEMAQGDGLLTPAQIEKAMIVGVKIKEALARSHKAGVTIAFGTDMGVGPHGQNAREFGFMVEAGMRSSEAIKAATVNAAKLLDLFDEVGTIASDKSADVIAVDSSPLDDVSVLQRVAFVMARGDIYLGVT